MFDAVVLEPSQTADSAVIWLHGLVQVVMTLNLYYRYWNSIAKPHVLFSRMLLKSL